MFLKKYCFLKFVILKIAIYSTDSNDQWPKRANTCIIYQCHRITFSNDQNQRTHFHLKLQNQILFSLEYSVFQSFSIFLDRSKWLLIWKLLSSGLRPKEYLAVWRIVVNIQKNSIHWHSLFLCTNPAADKYQYLKYQSDWKITGALSP